MEQLKAKLREAEEGALKEVETVGGEDFFPFSKVVILCVSCGFLVVLRIFTFFIILFVHC